MNKRLSRGGGAADWDCIFSQKTNKINRSQHRIDMPFMSPLVSACDVAGSVSEIKYWPGSGEVWQGKVRITLKCFA